MNMPSEKKPKKCRSGTILITDSSVPDALADNVCGRNDSGDLQHAMIFMKIQVVELPHHDVQR
ncbi:hypothetical protein MTF65_22735 [Streptomyces sp. APSN-46.1]|uniref:hypothetical protein n=1 Tax=Streptomyces sp. APSN-46.1 TaxID=2929049 RepID=UPI001FB433F4|nr:hypothetical protein [Streptomyces sp. APSN-46.1]MCJ1680103.1 hypothetical protein [Streptomyces sp. APSN-46.1]